MKTIYAKTLLFLYTGIEEILSEIDQVVEDRAVASMNDTSPVLEQALGIIKLTEDKVKLIELKKLIDTILKQFTSYEQVVLDYNYFKRLSREDYAKFDFKSRTYFRKKKSIIDKFSTILTEKGITDEYFEKEYLSIKLVKRFFKLTSVYENGIESKNDYIQQEKTPQNTCVIREKEVI